MLDHIVVLFFIFGGTPYCFPQWLHQFTAPPTVHSFLFSKSSPAFGISHVFDDSHSDRYEIMVLICTSLMVSDVELGEVLQMPPYHDPVALTSPGILLKWGISGPTSDWLNLYFHRIPGDLCTH